MKKHPIAFAIIAIIGASAAHAEMFKCVVAGQVQYSDQPCGASSTVIKSSPAMQGATSSSSIARQLDARVAAALSDGDIGRAEWLAVTAEQWQAVNQAKREAAMDATNRRAELDRAKQLKATEDLARETARPRKCSTRSNTSGYVGGNTLSATTTGTTTCR